MIKGKILLLSGNPGIWSPFERIHEKSYMNGVEAWAFALNADYRYSLKTNISDLQNYEIVICNSNLFALKHCLKLCLNRPKNQFWITMIEGSASDYLNPHPYFIELIDHSDLVNVINQKTLDYFRSLTKTRTEYIGIPYPVDEIRKFRVVAENRNRKIFICLTSLNRINDIMIARQTGLPFYIYENIISRKIKNIGIFFKNMTISKNYFLKKAIEKYPDLEVLPETSLKEYFRFNSKSFIWLNIDPRFTWGRFVLDAAALGIPMVTTSSTGHGDILFPFTCLNNEFDNEKALELIKRLSTDRDFYNQVSNYPENKMNYYKPENMVKRLFDFIK